MAWFAFDVDDYDADTMHLSAAEDGVYGRLIRFYYKTRLPLPDDDRALAGIARLSPQEWDAVKATMLPFFKPRAGKLHHKRIDAELDREDRLTKFRSERSKNAAAKRWGKTSNLDANAMPLECSSDARAMPKNATTPHHTREDIEKKDTRGGLTSPESGVRKNINGFNGHGGKWDDPNNRIQFAINKALPFLPGKDNGERWAIAIAAENPKDPNYKNACEAMRAATKRAKVGWISPHLRKE